MADLSTPVKRSPPAFFLGGIQVNEADNQSWFDALEAQSMNTVQVTEYARQGDWNTDHLSSDDGAAWVVEEIRGARQRGLAVVYVCRVHLEESEHNQFLWHGMIMPETDQLIASWFEKYGRFVVQRAELAEREGVEVFMIGSEMNALATTLPTVELPKLEEYFLNEEKQESRRRQLLARENLNAGNVQELAERLGFGSVESYIDARIAQEQQWARTAVGGDAVGGDAVGGDAVGGDVASPATVNRRRQRLQAHWQALIGKVRRVYSGRVGYAANFDHYEQVGFWPSLDIIGINAYFKLRDKLLPEESEQHLYPLLVDGWRAVLANIVAFRDAQAIGDMPVIFTEMGYTFRARSTVHPWADEGFALIPGPGADGVPRDHVVVWRDQPERFEERAWAVRALWQAHSELEPTLPAAASKRDRLLEGILYWKLSSHDYHFDDESFMVYVGADSDDPILPELRRFLESAL